MVFGGLHYQWCVNMIKILKFFYIHLCDSFVGDILNYCHPGFPIFYVTDNILVGNILDVCGRRMVMAKSA